MIERVDDDQMHARLKRAREHAGYETATDAAEAMGMKEPTYLAHENGSRGFWPDVPKYARFFKVRAMWLLTGAEPMLLKDNIEDRVEQLSPGKQKDLMGYLKYLEAKPED